MMNNHWIGDDGWMTSDEGYAPFGTPHASLPFRHFGLLYQASQPGQSELAWDVDHVQEDAWARARAWLASRPEDEEVTLRFFKHGWKQERFADPAQALERFDALPAFRAVDLLNLAIFDRQPIDRLPRAAPALQRAFSDPERSRDYALVIGPDTQGGLVYQHIGQHAAARRFFGANWAARALGARYDHVLDDQGYEASTLPAYLEALDTGEPIHDRILASIERPDREAVWCSMQRLVLPLPGDTLAVTVVMTPESEIPFLV